MSTENTPIRLQLYLARCGLGSRRKCEGYIDSGRIAVNGETVTRQGLKVTRADHVEFDGRPVKPSRAYRYYLLNKPPGYLCTNYDPEGRSLALELLPQEEGVRLFSVGRLDMYSEGLIIFTNDGEFANAVMHPSGEVEKSYLVQTSRDIAEEQLRNFTRGVVVEGVRYVVQTYERRGPREAVLTLTEGKNREIRNLLAHAGVGIRRLVRIRIGPVELGGLARGEYRSLTSRERDLLAPHQHSGGNPS
jgi:23S rRNA pseudouridine2605 synthase